MTAPEQLGFAGFEPPADPAGRGLKRPPAPKGGACRLFFALQPSADAVAKIQDLYAGLKSQHGLSGALVANERLHLTLDHLGDFAGFPADVVTTACVVASGLKVAPFTISLAHVVSFGRHAGNLPLVLKASTAGNTPMLLFRKALWQVLAQSGVPGPANASFSPHVTLRYDPVAIAEQAVTPIVWTARDFVLLRSFVGDNRYEELGRWPLQA